MILRAGLLALALLTGQVVTWGQQPCPQCGQIHPANVTTTPQLSGQAVAQARANFLARGGRGLYRRVGGHPGRGAGVAHFSSVGSFEGTGMTSRRFAPRESIATCRPSGRSSNAPDNSRRLVGDAHATGPDGTYRVRIWGSPSGNTRTTIRTRTRQPLLRRGLFRR